jgi:high-affinity iron transporter
MKNVGEAVAAGHRSLAALSIVVGIAVLREGSEIVLFLYGIAISGNDTAATMAVGGFLGLILGIAIGAVTYFGLLRISNRHLFAVTGWLIALLAAGMASQAMAFLQQAQVVTSFTKVLWDTSGLISDGSVIGKVLHTLVGYTARPTGMQFMVYLATLVCIFTLMRLFGHACHQPKPAILITT